MKMSEAIIEFGKAQEGVTASTTRTWYARRLAVFAPLGRLSLCEVSPGHLREVWSCLANRRQRWVKGTTRPPATGGLSPATLDGYFRAWRAFFRWACDQEFIDRSPVNKLKRPRLPDQPPKAISENDLCRLLKAAADSERDYALLTFLALTGCRVGGLAGLRMNDLDLDCGRAWVTEKGRGGGKRRQIYVHAEALTALRVYLAGRPREDGPVFLSRRGGPLGTGGVYLLLKRLAAKAGIKGRHNPHSLRHRYARSVLEAGADLATLAQLLGHSDPTVTIRYYARWADNELDGRARKFARLPRGRDS